MWRNVTNYVNFSHSLSQDKRNLQQFWLRKRMKAISCNFCLSFDLEKERERERDGCGLAALMQ